MFTKENEIFIRIAILSCNQKLNSTRRLIDVATARGHVVAVFDVLRCYMNVMANNPKVHYEG